MAPDQPQAWTRRRFIAGAGMAGVAALGTQFVSARAAFGEPANGVDAENCLVTVFLRGAADGLRILVPDAPSLGGDYLRRVRPGLMPGPSNRIALPGGWALNGAIKPLYDALWKSGGMAFVPAVSSPGITRSHFQAQQFLERGGNHSESTGWLERVVANLRGGSSFRALASSTVAPAAFAGPTRPVTVSSISGFTYPGWSTIRDDSRQALQTLYSRTTGNLRTDFPAAMSALHDASLIRPNLAGPGSYPTGSFSASLRDIAATIKAKLGLRVATVDVGGWDTHTDEATDLDRQLHDASLALEAFFADLGPANTGKVTVIVMTEFGRRVASNDSGGSDHGHGSVMWLLGGGLRRSDVFGKWNELTDSVLDHGDVPGLNDPFAILAEVLQNRLNISESSIFQDRSKQVLGVAKR